MMAGDQGFIIQSFLFARFNYALSKQHVAHSLVWLEAGSVVLEELLLKHPRYEGVVVMKPMPSTQIPPIK